MKGGKIRARRGCGVVGASPFFSGALEKASRR
jgi:hypothetical protein